MKPKLIFYLALVLFGGLWIIFISSAKFSNWALERKRNPNNQTVVNWAADWMWAKSPKTPRIDTKVVLYRANGQTVQLDAKAAVYSVFFKMNLTNQSKPLNYPVVAFIDPATRNVWIGLVNTSAVQKINFINDAGVELTNYYTETNLYFETDSKIFVGDNVLCSGSFGCCESLIKQAPPGVGLDGVFDQVDKATGGLLPFPQVCWETFFGDCFRENFFSSGNLGAQSTPIQHIAVADGKLRLDFNSLKYGTKGSVWLDLKTFKVRRAIEYRTVPYIDLVCWGIIPAFIAMLLARAALFLMRKTRGVANRILNISVLAGIIWSLFMLYRIHILGAWPTYLPILRPVIALGDWAMYIPVMVIGFAAVFTLAQALAVRFGKQK